MKQLLILVLISTFLVSNNAPADTYCAFCIVYEGEDGADGLDGVDYLNENFLDQNDFDEMFAAGFALSGIDFTNTTNALQLGVGVGGFGNEIQTAVGVALLVDSDKMGDVLFSFKTLVEEVGLDDGNEHRPWSASAVWKVKIW